MYFYRCTIFARYYLLRLISNSCGSKFATFCYFVFQLILERFKYCLCGNIRVDTFIYTSGFPRIIIIPFFETILNILRNRYHLNTISALRNMLCSNSLYHTVFVCCVCEYNIFFQKFQLYGQFNVFHFKIFCIRRVSCLCRSYCISRG